MLDVLVATIDAARHPGGLQYLGEHRILTDTRAPWAAAANALLDQAADAGHDALFIDDDVELLPGSLDLVQTYYDHADLFGINLIAPNGPGGWYVQSAGHMLRPADGGLAIAPFDSFATSIPCLVFHAGTSCMYIKHRALADKRVRFPEHWTGVHHEDVYYCASAWLAGYRVARLPSTAIHYTHEIGAGQTKAVLPNFHSGREENMTALIAWMGEQNVAQKAADGAIPIGVWAMDGAYYTLRGTQHISVGASHE